MKPLSEAVYRIQGPSGSKQRRVVVHFDRLKPFSKGTEFVTLTTKRTDETRLRSKRPATLNDQRPHSFVVEHVDDDDDAEVTTTRRYPHRVRHAPSRYSDFIPLTSFNVGHISSKKGAM